ncbi:MAG: hypothetical protein JNK85_08100 [Verrucomicrobiales bacterium]|nr:hypothetical protein [Verrucomicrobiales bacterium]
MNWNTLNPRWTSLLLVAAACTFGSSSPAAEEHLSAKRPIPGILSAVDEDKDGTLSESELDRAGKALRAMDTDGDGKVGINELRRGRGNRRSAEADANDGPPRRRQERAVGEETPDGKRALGRQNREAAGASAVERERGPGGERREAIAEGRPARERRRENVDRPGAVDRSRAEIRRQDDGRGPRRSARLENKARRGEHNPNRPEVARRGGDGRDSRERICAGCGRPMGPAHRGPAATERRAPGRRG